MNDRTDLESAVDAEPSIVDPPPKPRSTIRPPVYRREPLAIILIVAFFDLLVYHSDGYAGYSVWLVVVAVAFSIGVPAFRPQFSTWLIALLMLILAARMIWQGSDATFVAGCLLLAAFTFSLSGRQPYVLDVALAIVQTLVAGLAGFIEYLDTLLKSGRSPARNPVTAAIVLPVVAVLLFGAIFIMANPDLVSAVSEFGRGFIRWLEESMSRFRPDPVEIITLAIVAYLAIGLFRPLLTASVFSLIELPASDPPAAPKAANWLPAFRNTLLALIGLFIVYLVFEFRTLWFREFPEGFYYAGYAHEGAAWLTAALALATLVLSIIFRGAVMNDPRVGQLRLLAWIWSGLNLLLAAAVYNRMHIYVDFNGMTRMRTIGLLGITCVVAGFLLVVWKIIKHRGFSWLIRRQLWTLAFFVYLYLLLPVDWLVHTYNVNRVLAGDLAPVVQITEHPVSNEGILTLPPLLECEDPIISEGIRAMLAKRHAGLEAQLAIRSERNWTAYQMSDERLFRELESSRDGWVEFATAPEASDAAWDRFRKYAYRWY